MQHAARAFGLRGRRVVTSTLALAMVALAGFASMVSAQGVAPASAGDAVAPLIQRLASAKPALYVEPTGPTTSINYADGQQHVYDTETRWRGMCGSSPLTELQLKEIAESHKAAMANPGNILIIDTPREGANTRVGLFNLIFSINTANMPVGAAASFTAAEAYIESKFSDPVTITVTVSWANLGGGVIGSTGSEYVNSVAYAISRTGLINGQDPSDTIQDFLPSTSTIPVRYDATSATVTNESVVFWTRAAYKSTVGSSAGTDASMTYNSTFSFDFDPSNGVGGAQLSLVDTIVHEVGHCLGFTSAADFRTNDIEALDLFRFARIDRVGLGNTNPDSTADFMTVAREVDINNPTNDDVISDVISAEYRMSDGNPNQASHFFDQGSAIGIMDPTLANGQTFFPEYYRTSDYTMFDAIGWDDTTCLFPSISTPPAGQTVCTGAAINLSVTAINGTLTYQWRKATVNIVGATASTYNDPSAAAGDAGSYDVVVTNACGSITSTAAVVAVTALPTISSQPAPLTRCTGTSATFTVVAGSGGPFTYQWRKNTVNIVGQTATSLIIPSVVVGDAANYDVIVNGACGGTPSNTVALTVNEAITVTVHPIPQTVCSGDTVSFVVAATGTAPSFQWRKGGVDIPGAITSTLNLGPVSAASAGSYHCRVTNVCGFVNSNLVALVVNTGPAFTVDPSSQSICDGLGVVFSAAVSGTPAPTLQWRKGGVPIGGQTGTSYTIPAIDAGSAGSYDVVATNSCGSVPSTPAVLTVLTTPVFSLQPVSVAACDGDPFAFIVTATSTVTYQWRLGGVPIGGATNATFGGTATGLTAGSYDCVLTNSCGSTPSNPATLGVGTGPSITTQPIGAAVASGAPLTLTVAATGSAPISYQWRKDTTNLSNAGAYSGVLTASLDISAVTASEVGSYDAVLTNACGIATSDPASVTLNTVCPADLDNGSGLGVPDGGVDVSDLLFFLEEFSTGSLNADLDNGSGLGVPDGGVDISDLLFFLDHFSSGC